MDDVSFGLTILFGVWIFFVTARPHRNNNSSQADQSFLKHGPAELRPSETDNWSFDLESTDRNVVEQKDHWVLS